MQPCLDRSSNAEREEKFEICVEIVRFLHGTLGTEMRVESPANPAFGFHTWSNFRFIPRYREDTPDLKSGH